MGEPDNCRPLAVGAGAPAGPDPGAEDEEPPADVVQAVAEFVADLVEEAGVPDEPDEDAG